MAELIVTQPVDGGDLGWLHHYWQRPIARIFFIYDVPEGASRGYHRHQHCQMGLTCLAGAVTVYSQNPHTDGFYRLDSPTLTLLLAPADWRVMFDFSADARLMVVADRSFAETVYIDDPYRPFVMPPSSLLTQGILTTE